MEVVLFIGLQGSGKSTFYRNHFALTHFLISKDLFRGNRRPQRRQMHLIEEALKQGHSVVVDNTNPTLEDRAAIIGLAKAHGAKVSGFYFDSALADCLERNRSRSGKDKVPDAALHITLKRLRLPTSDEGFDRLQRVRLSPDNVFSISEWTEDSAMRSSDFEKRMRAGECFHSLRLLPTAWVVLRLDGHGFTRFTNRRFEKPFDPTFQEYMVETTQKLLERFHGVYGYTESDEISILLSRRWDLFDRELEKAISLSAALASATFSLACGEEVQFDSRARVGAREEDVVDRASFP